jgi:nitroreductase
MEEKISAGIEQYFSNLEDPRVDRTKLHKQVDILVIAVCAVASQAWVRESDQFNARMIDAAIVADHLILAAANLGLGTCWIAAFNVKAARQVLCLPEDVEPAIFTPLGYPADQPQEKIRKPLSELVRYEHW